MNRTARNSIEIISSFVFALTIGSACIADDPSPLPSTQRESKPYDDDPTDNQENQPGAFSSPDNTFDHNEGLSENGYRDPFEIATQRQEEGPPERRVRLHSCQKMQIQSLRNLLTGLGVNLDNTAAQGAPATAGDLLDEGATALGAANYGARTGEALVWTSAGAAKQFDIFVQAAPEVIANLASAPLCQIDGVGPNMFNDDDTCNVDAVSCLIGKSATPEHVALCSSIVKKGSDLETGKRVAVAAMLSGAHSCE
jgi:hypothetical protein